MLNTNLNHTNGWRKHFPSHIAWSLSPLLTSRHSMSLYVPTFPSLVSVLGFAVCDWTATIAWVILVWRSRSSDKWSSLKILAASFTAESKKKRKKSKISYLSNTKPQSAQRMLPVKWNLFKKYTSEDENERYLTYQKRSSDYLTLTPQKLSHTVPLAVTITPGNSHTRTHTHTHKEDKGKS